MSGSRWYIADSYKLAVMKAQIIKISKMKHISLLSFIIYFILVSCHNRMDHNSNVIRESEDSIDSINIINNKRNYSADTFDIHLLIKELKQRDSSIFLSVDFDTTPELTDKIISYFIKRQLKKENEEFQEMNKDLQDDIDEMEQLLKELQLRDSALYSHLIKGDSLVFEKTE
jgi:DNA gyrase/topoisomerase IV subunit A